MSAVKRQALGRGLGALIPGASPPPAAPPAPPARRDYFQAAIEELHPNPDQPRQRFDEAKLDELARSIRETGIAQALLVRVRKSGGFEIVAGERRWRAAQRAGLHEVPVVVKDVTDARAYELALVENVQREDLNPIEEAEAYQHLADQYGYTQEQLAQRVGKDRSTVTNTLRLLKLPPEVRGLVQDGKLSMGHARALLGLDEAAAIVRAAYTVVERALSVRDTELLVRRLREGAPATPAKPAKTVFVRDLEERLTKALGAKIRISDKGSGKGGKIEIQYGDLDALERITERLF